MLTERTPLETHLYQTLSPLAQPDPPPGHVTQHWSEARQPHFALTPAWLKPYYVLGPQNLPGSFPYR